MIDKFRSNEPLSPPPKSLPSSVHITYCRLPRRSGIGDLGLGAVCPSFLLHASGVCRARVLRADRAGAPSTPGGLGYMMVVRLMDLGRVCYGILDLCFEGGLSFLSASIASKFRPRTENAH
jgi:hypothetical protein